jgi:hypothetical protein
MRIERDQLIAGFPAKDARRCMREGAGFIIRVRTATEVLSECQALKFLKLLQHEGLLAAREDFWEATEMGHALAMATAAAPLRRTTAERLVKQVRSARRRSTETTASNIVLVPAPAELIAELHKHTRQPNCQFLFPSPAGNREQHMLDRCKAGALRDGLDPAKFDLKTFRSTYATRMLRQGFDVRTMQHWMGHKSFETTMRYLVPATDVHGKLDQVTIPKPQKSDTARKSPARETRSSRR